MPLSFSDNPSDQDANTTTSATGLSFSAHSYSLPQVDRVAQKLLLI